MRVYVDRPTGVQFVESIQAQTQRKEAPWTITPLIEDSSCNTRPKSAQRWEWLAERSELVQANRRQAASSAPMTALISALLASAAAVPTLRASSPISASGITA